MNEERIYQELKCINTSQIRGEEKLKNIDDKFGKLNGSVKMHEIRIGKIEKNICYVLGAMGMLSIIWTIFVAIK